MRRPKWGSSAGRGPSARPPFLTAWGAPQMKGVADTWPRWWASRRARLQNPPAALRELRRAYGSHVAAMVDGVGLHGQRYRL